MSFRPLRLPLAVALLALTLAACETEFEAPQELTLQARAATEVLPAGASYLARVNLQAVQEHNHFATVSEDLDFSNADARFQDFFDATGFDPKTDIEEIYVAVEGDGEDARPSIVAYASYDRDRLQDFIDERLSDEIERTTYQGATIYRSRTDDDFAFALTAENMLVASADIAKVEAMLDRLAGGGTALAADAEAMALIGRVSAGDAWVVVRTFPQANPEADASDELSRQAMDLYGTINQAAAAFDVDSEEAEMTVFLRAADGVSSDDVADLVRGFVAAMKAQPDIDAAMMKTLDDVDVRSQDGLVRVRARVGDELFGRQK